MLMREPDSALMAAKSGWEYPVSREYIVGIHTYDLLAAVNSGKGKKPKPYPNPFPKKDVVKTGKTERSTAEVKRLLAKMNPKE
jgi:hypothetical protein